MKSVKFLVLAFVSLVAFASCNREESAYLALEHTSLYFESWSDDPQTISYTPTNAVSVAIASYSNGWNAAVDMGSRTITIWPVGATEEGMTNDDLPKEGSVVVNALNKEGEAASYHINVYVTQTHSLDANGAANCYVVTAPSVSYKFNVMHRPDGEPLGTKRVELLWQSNIDIVKNVDKVGDDAVFYIKASSEDAMRVEDTNAVIAAYNAAGDVIWSWHLWIVNENPFAATDTYSNGKTFMRNNLGAFTNAGGSTDELKILNSYGMFYQWGRKDPFPRPLYFDATGAYDEDRYGETGTYIKENFVERTATDATIDYTIKHPMYYICNSEHSEYNGDKGNGVGDWLANGDNALWCDTAKSLYDPCPYGWRVPTAEDLSVLRLSDAEDNTPLEEARKQYGWNLSDGVSSYFWSACGRRRYNDGKVENMNHKDDVYPVQPQPWEGYYWTSTASSEGGAVALYFDLTTSRTINKFVTSSNRFRANGFQVRCVKE